MRASRPHSAPFTVLFLVVSFFGTTTEAELWPTGREAVELQAQPFALSAVRLLDGPFAAAMQRDRKYLLELEGDRLMHHFWKTAGLPAPADPMGGWEKTELRGHTMGHYLSACAQMYASTGDEALKARCQLLVSQLARCQQANGEGYLSAFPKSFIDRVVARQPVWAPFYTLHKILAGLIDVHVHCDNAQALEVAEAMAGWMDERLKPLDREAFQAMLVATEQGGMNDVLANLYGLTGERRWLELSRRFVQDRYVEPLAKGEDRLKGEHVNSFIPNIVGTARQYELTGDEVDRRIAEYFWNQVTSARCYCTGGTSNQEHWRTGPNQLASELGDHTQETCCTYNMLKLTRHLFSWQPQGKYADYYERALWNSILGTQDPDTGMMLYFVTLGSGRWKTFNTPRDSFWCCTGSGMENHARYGEAIYCHDDHGLWVNQFIASEVTWKDKGVRIRQETQFPEQERTSLVVHTQQPTHFALRVREPSWAETGFSVSVNGQVETAARKEQGYIIIDRQWKDGDRVDVQLPMHLWSCPLPGAPQQVAVMYGPLVLAGELDGEPLPKDHVYTTENWFKFPPQLIADAPTIVTEKTLPADWCRPVENQVLTFRTVNVGRPHDVTLVPYHRLWGQRYAVYWQVLSEDQWKAAEAERRVREAERQALLGRRVDHVEIGDVASERAHGLEGEKMASGPYSGRMWRHASDGGWFSYRLKVLNDQPMTLLWSCWGSEGGRRTFDVLVDGEKIATQTLNQNKPGEFFEVQHVLPPAMLQDKQEVTVRFQAHPENTAGGIFGLWMLKPAE